MINADVEVSTQDIRDEESLKERRLSDNDWTRPCAVQANDPVSFSRQQVSLPDTYFRTNGKSYAESVTT